jgi:hypothetical protein
MTLSLETTPEAHVSAWERKHLAGMLNRRCQKPILSTVPRSVCTRHSDF